MTPIGSRRMIEVKPAMYSPAERPSSTRAAPAKKRIWSIIGGISSAIVTAIGLPVFCDSSATSSSACASSASAISSSASWRSDGVVSRHVSKAADGRGVGTVDVLGARDRRGAEHLAGARVDEVAGAALGRRRRTRR